MKKFILVAMLIGALAVVLAGTALAAGPVTPPTQGFGPGMGMHTPGTGQTTPSTGYGPGMDASAGGGMTLAPALRSGVPGMAGHAGVGRGMPEWAGESEAVEKLLGMTEEQIQAERLAGKSLVQIAASKKISEETLIKTILDAKKADLAKLVTDGKLTQAQMDTMLERMQTQVKTMVERTTTGPAFEQGQARPGMGMRQSQEQGQGQAQPGGMMGPSRGGRGATR